MRSRGPGLLTIVVALVAAVVTVGVVLSAVAGHRVVRREEARQPVVRVLRPDASRARAVLRAWDHQRAAAWSEGDLGALRALYVEGSVTGRHDVAMLSAYRDRGLRVTDMARQVLRFRVRKASPRTLALVVTDRLVDARVVGPGVGAEVPDGRPVTRLVRMARAAGAWRVVEVERAQPAR